MRANNARAHIAYLMATGLTFELSSSNYTTGIKCDAWKAKYVSTMQSNRTFACFAKLKKAVKEKPVPNVTNEDVKYFQHNFKRDIYIEQVTNIDIKSAYATILYNDGYIDKETYDYICASRKQERLASVGMLASRKNIFEFRKGKPVAERSDVSLYSGFFFYAAKRTFEIMDELRQICNEDYLYTWVDGIYFLPNEKAQAECKKFLDSIGFKHTVDNLASFDVHLRPDLVRVTFLKDGKQKIFNLPSLNNEFKRVVIDSILSLNNKKNKYEKGKDQGPVQDGGRNRAIHRRK